MHPHIHASNTPDKAACIFEPSGTVLTYRDLDSYSNQVAHLLRSCGLRRGDGVGVFMNNNPHYFEICWGIQRSGLCLTPISSRLTAPEVAYIVRDCGAKALFASDDMSVTTGELLTQLPSMLGLFMTGSAIAGYEPYLSARDSQLRTPISDESRGTDMLYSSGTTGRPKGIARPPSDLPIDAEDPLVSLLSGLYQFDSETRYLSPAPLYHAAPLRYCLGVQQLGGTVVMMDHFDPESALSLLEKYKITHSQWVPTMFVRMLKLPSVVRSRYDLSHLRVAIHAAAPCPVEVKRQMLEWWGNVIYEYYAGSEGNGFTAISPEEWRLHEGSVGLALLGVVHICGDDGHEVSVGEEGTIYFENPDSNYEYHNDPEKTRESIHPVHSTWSTLGDVGRVDADDYLYLTDRKSFMIISGGVNIYPQETENILIMHPSVLDVAVIGVPNEDFGEEVKAVVELVSDVVGSADLEAELISFCRAHLSGLKCPRSVDFTDSLPRHPTGKLYKRILRDRYWGKHDSKIV